MVVGRGGGGERVTRNDSAVILFQSVLHEALVGRSGMGDGVGDGVGLKR